MDRYSNLNYDYYLFLNSNTVCDLIVLCDYEPEAIRIVAEYLYPAWVSVSTADTH